MTNQPSLFSFAARFLVRVPPVAAAAGADFAVVIDSATGRSVATGTRAACVEFAERLDAKAAADEARGQQ